MSASQPKEPSSKSVSRSSMALAKRVTEAADRTGMLYFTTTSADGRVVSTPAGELVNFASCSYLGLETSAELVAGATSAMARYGVQLSSSRVYLQTDLYREAEELLGEIMGARVLVFPSTTLTHFGIMPALITPKDAVILDAYVHASVQACVRIVQASGTRVSHFPHSDLDALRAEVISLRADGVKGRIWVMVDGIYSMRGDTVPAAGLVALAEELDLTLYVDDAHGFSWTGASGRGWWLENAPATDCAIVVGSLSKSFAAAGGLAVFPDEASFSLARVLSGSLLFSGPLPPASLGGAKCLCASSPVFLSAGAARGSRGPYSFHGVLPRGR